MDWELCSYDSAMKEISFILDNFIWFHLKKYKFWEKKWFIFVPAILKWCIWILFSAGQGSFLVRPSENSPGNYSLFVLCDKVVQRFRIEKQGKQFLMGGRYFDRFVAFIKFAVSCINIYLFSIVFDYWSKIYWIFEIP